MGKLDGLTQKLIEFIEQQKVFFVATAMREGTINLSPKGMDSFRVIDGNKIIWLNLTGSGNETAAHLLESNRMTVMFCSFSDMPLILRLYGNAKAYHPRDAAFENYIAHFPEQLGSRQVIEMQIDLVQTSCGFGVPLMDFKEERTTLTEWTEKKGVDGVKQYWLDKNTISLDGHPTKIIE